MGKIFIEFAGGTTGLGDVICIMPLLDRFREYNKSEIFIQVRNPIAPKLFQKTYPEIKFIPEYPEDLSIFDKAFSLIHEKHDVPLQQIFAPQLGFFDGGYVRPKVDSFRRERPIQNKYVTIGIHATAQLKYWNHPSGKRVQPQSPNWDSLCSMIRKSGYTPVVVDLYETYGVDNFRNGVPKKANKKIGMPIEDVMNYIEHSEFFIGPSSGLAWLAHAAGKPVCIVSNFTEDWNEFDLTLPDYKRITNKAVCHGCWNKINVDFQFDNMDWYWCPLHKGTNRQFECHTSITPEMVFEEIKEWLV